MALTEISSLSDGRLFVSTEQTGTGSEQDIAHGHDRAPIDVFVSVTDSNAAADNVITEGTHDATNIKITCTTSVLYKVFAVFGAQSGS